jgi:hypothetical protein
MSRAEYEGQNLEGTDNENSVPGIKESQALE